MKKRLKSVISAAALFLLGLGTVFSLVKLIISVRHGFWEAATTCATLLVGFIAACVVVWQGYLIKQQIAFSTYLDLDNEWNSEEMIDIRKTVHAPQSDNWDLARLEGILEFFEKFALMYRLSGDMSFIYQSTVGWYAAQYFLFAREHGQIKKLRELWHDEVYQDLEHLYKLYLINEVGRGPKAQKAWEAKRLTTEKRFWQQERKE
jgi:hypothetical protein